MTRSSLTEETPATPGWVDRRVREVFAPLGEAGVKACDAYAACLAEVRGAVDVDAGHDRCRAQALRTVRDFAPDAGEFDRALQALEAEIAQST